MHSQIFVFQLLCMVGACATQDNMGVYDAPGRGEAVNAWNSERAVVSEQEAEDEITVYETMKQECVDYITRYGDKIIRNSFASVVPGGNVLYNFSMQYCRTKPEEHLQRDTLSKYLGGFVKDVVVQVPGGYIVVNFADAIKPETADTLTQAISDALLQDLNAIRTDHGFEALAGDALRTAVNQFPGGRYLTVASGFVGNAIDPQAKSFTEAVLKKTLSLFAADYGNLFSDAGFEQVAIVPELKAQVLREFTSDLERMRRSSGCELDMFDLEDEMVARYIELKRDTAQSVDAPSSEVLLGKHVGRAMAFGAKKSLPMGRTVTAVTKRAGKMLDQDADTLTEAVVSKARAVVTVETGEDLLGGAAFDRIASDPTLRAQVMDRFGPELQTADGLDYYDVIDEMVTMYHQLEKAQNQENRTPLPNGEQASAKRSWYNPLNLFS